MLNYELILFRIIFLGLDKLPRFLSDTMLPTTSPEKTMEATVLVNGGYDPCHYEVFMSYGIYLQPYAF